MLTNKTQAIMSNKPSLKKITYSRPPVPLKFPQELLPDHTTPNLPPLTELPCPSEDHLLVFSPTKTRTWATRDWCSVVVNTLQEALPVTGAVLLHGLPVHTIEDFEELFQGVQQLGDVDEWELQDYKSIGMKRPKLGKYDLTTGINENTVLPLHSESVYNPVFPKYIGLMCLQDAEEGGENVIGHTSDITSKAVPPKLKQMLQQHAGELFVNKLFDATKNTHVAGAFQSWQYLCNLKDGEGRPEVEKYYTDSGFQTSDLHWDEEGTLTIKTTYSGYIDGEWCNSLPFFRTFADGTPVPSELLAEFEALRWRQAYGLKLKPGDWLVLENAKVQHGRLQFKNGQNKRTIVVNLWGKKTHL
eukprot:TRINITY_DN612_c0_g1_i10.p1 TRINITY_DN612_c0_g1~~TRINITY_DN612_c0_g1_i10.p1  ORF type:complete len:358 (+),score=42.59 TRINITY_DN612_c0_g1_i10:226-1299(+)